MCPMSQKIPTRLDVAYYQELISRIRIPNDKTYFDLFERRHNVEFVWTVPNDDNRVADALYLRELYTHRRLSLQGATFLEVLVALSERVAFTDGASPDLWAWRLIKNLKLNKMSDPLSPRELERVDRILETVIWRTYRPDGQGGFFPLKNPEQDQTKVEIWYQMNAYLIEKGQ